ncbi:MAG: Kelch repeat-containing protein [archaeon]
MTLEPMPTSRMHFGVAVVDGKIYAIGGYKGYSGSYLASNEMYDPATNTWITKASMLTPRSGFGVAVVDNKIYVIGGLTGSNIFTNVNEVYDHETDTWETLTPMPTARSALEANVVDGKIYVIGGTANVNEVYDTETDTWIALEPMPTSVGYYASAVVSTKIYIFGGAVEVDLTQIYDTKTNTWNNGTELPTGVDSAAAAVIEVEGTQKICVIGGKQNLDAVDLNQIYDPETDTWSMGTSKPTARYGLAVAVVDNLVYAIGGAPSFPHASQKTNEQYTPAGYIPEFSSWIVLPLFLGSAFMIVFVKKKNGFGAIK